VEVKSLKMFMKDVDRFLDSKGVRGMGRKQVYGIERDDQLWSY